MGFITAAIEIRTDEESGRRGPFITLPKKVYREIGQGPLISLRFGTSRVQTPYFCNDTEDTISVSKELAEVLPLYNALKTNVIVKERELHFGPVIGTFTDSLSVRLAAENRPGNKIKNLNLANNEAGTMIYFFSADDFDSTQNRIIGTYFNSSAGKWEKRLFPLPDVLYDRGGSSLKSQRKLSEKIRQTIESSPDVKKFNPLYIFDKWDVHKKLVRFVDMKPHMPYSLRYSKAEDLELILGKSPVLYVKDRLGNRGLGVARVQRFNNGTFEFSYFKKELFSSVCSSFEELIEKINEVFKDKRAILQCGIDVIKVNNGNVDMRATVQRNGEGKIEIVALPVRVGKEGSPITSTRSGSLVYRFEEFFEECMGYSQEQTDKLKGEAEDFLIRAYRHIEECYGIFGEIGIDFAVDTSGKVWFIECNAKPGKDTVIFSYDDDTVKRAFLNPLKYAKYICGF